MKVGGRGGTQLRPHIRRGGLSVGDKGDGRNEWQPSDEIQSHDRDGNECKRATKVQKAHTLQTH